MNDTESCPASATSRVEVLSATHPPTAAPAPGSPGGGGGEAEQRAAAPAPAPEAAHAPPAGGGGNFDRKTARWRHQLDECIQKPPEESTRKKAERMFKTPYVISIVVFVVSFLLLLVLRPPMVHTPGKTDIERGKLSIARLLLWSLVAALLVLFVPMVWKRSKK